MLRAYLYGIETEGAALNPEASLVGCEPTYMGLKHEKVVGFQDGVISCEPTYMGLKRGKYMVSLSAWSKLRAYLYGIETTHATLGKACIDKLRAYLYGIETGFPLEVYSVRLSCEPTYMGLKLFLSEEENGGISNKLRAYLYGIETHKLKYSQFSDILVASLPIWD